MAKAGLEMAWWDLQGKAEGRSLRDLLGGARERVEVGVSVGLQESPEALVRTVQGYLEEGYRRVKIKIKPGRDVGDARAVRAAFPHLRLQVDANSAYTLEDAAALLPLDELDLLLIEQPLAEDDLWDHSRLQAQLAHAALPGREHPLRPPCPPGAGDGRLPGDQHQGRAGGRAERGARHPRPVPGAGCAGVVRRHAGDGRGAGRQPGAGRAARFHACRAISRPPIAITPKISPTSALLSTPTAPSTCRTGWG